MDSTPSTNPTLRPRGPRDVGRANAAAGLAEVSQIAQNPRGHVLFPDHYCWYIVAGVMDILLTWLILHLGGREVNAIAQAAIVLAGHWGLIVLKMVSIALVILICEYIGRRDPRRQTIARRLATFAIAVSALPPTLAVLQLAVLAVNGSV